MSDILEAIKDAIIPKRREQATVETYDPHTRGPYPDRASAENNQPQISPPRAPAEAQDSSRAERNDLGSASDTHRSRAGSGDEPVDYGEAMAKPVHKEGGKYGLS
ncbi:predicted protein [Chaetomium globosum CBS 148.51]|uniref:Uncharacterized protein n=1 Tax=Chaetomium globosum (strain ATCC 6205 / CBS 148.51 / DSM 1962 / NBRC 6347 / NRRL 1970) TaxID=306901 RepID=Q2GR45_CHAGB|nr:uncharacterized protein CHGG_09559 [Chaetomium globosum CBS 148.51]EAQ85545.1 predicted protein [Chaetomium globosum CBS 148.51]